MPIKKIDDCDPDILKECQKAQKVINEAIELNSLTLQGVLNVFIHLVGGNVEQIADSDFYEIIESTRRIRKYHKANKNE